MALRPSDRHYRNTVIRLPDLAVTETLLKGLTFENCEIVGPAVIVPLNDTEISHCQWDAGSPDDVFWTIPTGRNVIYGAIGLEGCRIVGCRMRNIGLGIPEDRIEQVRKGFGL